MKKDSKEFDNILNECLEQLLVRGESIEQCLTRYPEHAAELEPLLKTTLQVKKAVAIQPRPEFKARARYQFNSSLREAESKRSRPFFVFGWRSRWVTVIAVVLAVIMAGSGTVAAAGNSMPDGPLYPIKLATEQVRLTLTPSEIGKAEFYASLADKRVTEIIYMANKGKPEQVGQSTQRLNNCLAMIAVLAGAEGKEERVLAPPKPAMERGKGVSQARGKAKLRMMLGHHGVNNPARLRVALETAPELVKPALRQAIVVSDEAYKKALRALD